MRKTTLLSLVVVCAAALFVYLFWMNRPAAEVYIVKRGTAIAAVYGTVKVIPTATINVRARNSGIVELSEELVSGRVGIGMAVEEGQVLARIRNEDVDRELAKARAELRAAEQRREIGPPSEPQLKTQEAQLDRLRKLAELNNAPASEVERLGNEVRAFRERVRAELLEQERAVAVWGEQVRILEDRKERMLIRAPIKGALTAQNCVNGEFIGENSIPFIVATKALFLEGRINEEDVGMVSKGMKATVRLYSFADREFTAEVTQVLPTAADQRYTVNLNLEDPPENLMSGMTGEMNIISGKRENALIVPARALMVDRVFVVHDGAVMPRAVKVGFRSIERAEITEGLNEGELVVVADQDLLRAGQRVRAIPINM